METNFTSESAEAARAAASSASSFLASIAQWPFVFFRLFLWLALFHVGNFWSFCLIEWCAQLIKVIGKMNWNNWGKIFNILLKSFSSSPSACRRPELLRTQIHAVFFCVHLSFFRILKLLCYFGTYGRYTYKILVTNFVDEFWWRNLVTNLGEKFWWRTQMTNCVWRI